MAKKLGADKDTEKLVRTARKVWGQDAVRLTRGNHIQFFPPGSNQIILGALTGSTTSQRKLRGQLLKAGLPV